MRLSGVVQQGPASVPPPVGAVPAVPSLLSTDLAAKDGWEREDAPAGALSYLGLSSGSCSENEFKRYRAAAKKSAKRRFHKVDETKRLSYLEQHWPASGLSVSQVFILANDVSQTQAREKLLSTLIPLTTRKKEDLLSTEEFAGFRRAASKLSWQQTYSLLEQLRPQVGLARAQLFQLHHEETRGSRLERIRSFLSELKALPALGSSPLPSYTPSELACLKADLKVLNSSFPSPHQTEAVIEYLGVVAQQGTWPVLDLLPAVLALPACDSHRVTAAMVTAASLQQLVEANDGALSGVAKAVKTWLSQDPSPSRSRWELAQPLLSQLDLSREQLLDVLEANGSSLRMERMADVNALLQKRVLPAPREPFSDEGFQVIQKDLSSLRTDSQSVEKGRVYLMQLAQMGSISTAQFQRTQNVLARPQIEAAVALLSVEGWTGTAGSNHLLADQVEPFLAWLSRVVPDDAYTFLEAVRPRLQLTRAQLIELQVRLNRGLSNGYASPSARKFSARLAALSPKGGGSSPFTDAEIGLLRENLRRLIGGTSQAANFAAVKAHLAELRSAGSVSFVQAHELTQHPLSMHGPLLIDALSWVTWDNAPRGLSERETLLFQQQVALIKRTLGRKGVMDYLQAARGNLRISYDCATHIEAEYLRKLRGKEKDEQTFAVRRVLLELRS